MKNSQYNFFLSPVRDIEVQGKRIWTVLLPIFLLFFSSVRTRTRIEYSNILPTNRGITQQKHYNNNVSVVWSCQGSHKHLSLVFWYYHYWTAILYYTPNRWEFLCFSFIAHTFNRSIKPNVRGKKQTNRTHTPAKFDWNIQIPRNIFDVFRVFWMCEKRIRHHRAIVLEKSIYTILWRE